MDHLKVYSFSFNDAFGEQDEVTTLIDSIDPILNWHSYFPNHLFLISNKSAKEISILLKPYLKDKARIFITEVASNRAGWMSKNLWEEIRNPRPADDEKPNDAL